MMRNRILRKVAYPCFGAICSFVPIMAWTNQMDGMKPGVLPKIGVTALFAIILLLTIFLIELGLRREEKK